MLFIQVKLLKKFMTNILFFSLNEPFYDFFLFVFISFRKSTPDQIIYNSSQGDAIREKYMYNNTILSIGPAVEHLYEVMFL